MRPLFSKLILCLVPVTMLTTACSNDTDAGEVDAPPTTFDTEYKKPLYGIDESPAAKADGYNGAAGPTTANLSSTTAAWKVTRSWADKDSGTWPGYDLARDGEAKKLTWDEKYARWVESLPKLVDGWDTTFTLTTPWGKTMPAPRLECAETAMFLRATFASWYGLPFYMTAYSAQTGNIYVGHFGVVNGSGARVSGYPKFGTDFKDYTATFAGKDNAYIVAHWPKDAVLAKRILAGNKDDDNSAILGAGAYTGAYFDEIFLNKRAAQLIMRVLDNFGSIHLASTANMFNLKPEAVREGDTLLERWQRSGIGHTIVVKDVEHLIGDKLAITTMFGSMPRIQPIWYESDYSKSYFTSDLTGGLGKNYDGDEYATMGGGLKRWRTAIVKSGRWYNVVPTVDQASFVDGSDKVAIGKRPGKFAELMGELEPEEARDVMLERIALARKALQGKPASCSNRERREDAFRDLYKLSADAFDMSAEEVDREYRVLDDYMFPEMVYSQSKTCCWNSTTSDMYLIVLQMNQERANNVVDQQCQEPIPFENKGGYKVFADYAASIGMADKWKAWSEDEPCAQRAVAKDTETLHQWASFCSVKDDVLENTDAQE